MAYETEYTDFDPQEDSSACLTLGLATDIVESRYLRDFSTAEPEEKQQILKDLTTFLEQLLRQPQISGRVRSGRTLQSRLQDAGKNSQVLLVMERLSLLNRVRDTAIPFRKRKRAGKIQSRDRSAAEAVPPAVPG